MSINVKMMIIPGLGMVIIFGLSGASSPLAHVSALLTKIALGRFILEAT